MHFTHRLTRTSTIDDVCAFMATRYIVEVIGTEGSALALIARDRRDQFRSASRILNTI